jgi:hypothetical protein
MCDTDTFVELLSQSASFLIHDRVCNKSNTVGANLRARTAYPTGAHEFTPGFSGICVARSYLFVTINYIDRKSS